WKLTGPGGGAAARAATLRAPALTALVTDWRGRAGPSCRHEAVRPHTRLNRHVFDPMFERSVRPCAKRSTMREAHPLFSLLCRSAHADGAAALERVVREAPDRRLSRINVLDCARREGLNEQRAITTFLHATQIGLLDMSWNVLCPCCGGVLDANATLKT